MQQHLGARGLVQAAIEDDGSEGVAHENAFVDNVAAKGDGVRMGRGTPCQSLWPLLKNRKHGLQKIFMSCVYKPLYFMQFIDKKGIFYFSGYANMVF
jgi:hypothetical protein